MSFRMEFPWGNGKPKRWEVLCDFCPIIEHFSLTLFPDFPAAFAAAEGTGWEVLDNNKGRQMYRCPICKRGDGG